MIFTICFVDKIVAQSNNIKIDIDNNGVSDFFSYDNSSIKVTLNGMKFMQKIEKFGYENITEFKVENGVFSFDVNCGMCTGQYTYSYKLKVVSGNLKFIGYDVFYKYFLAGNQGVVTKSYNLATKKYIVVVTEFDIAEKENERTEKGVFKLRDIFFNTYTESSFSSLGKFGSSVEPE